MTNTKKAHITWFDNYIIDLYRKYKTVAQISRKTGLSTYSISKMLKEADLKYSKFKIENYDTITDMLTTVIRDADNMQLEAGGGTRHYVRDILLPLLDSNNLMIVEKPSELLVV